MVVCQRQNSLRIYPNLPALRNSFQGQGKRNATPGGLWYCHEHQRRRHPGECWDHVGFPLLGPFACLTQDVLSHTLKFYLDGRSLWRSERPHLWVECNFPLVRESGVLVWLLHYKTWIYKTRTTQVNTTSNLESLKEGAQTVEKNPKFFIFQWFQRTF